MQLSAILDTFLDASILNFTLSLSELQGAIGVGESRHR